MASVESIAGSADEVIDNISKVPKNVAHLLDEPVELICPACNQLNLSKIEYEAVTVIQKIVYYLNIILYCKPIRWRGRFDINHYCSKCGCFIGRYISLSWYKRALFRIQRSGIEENNKWQNFRKVEKEALDDKKLKRQRAAINKA